jgi:hypothetical protein
MQMGGGALLRAQVGGCDMPARAARDRLTASEISYVLGRREACRASWQACGEMVRRSVHDVRMACDPDYAKAHADTVAFEQPRVRLRDFGEVELRLLNVLACVWQGEVDDRRGWRAEIAVKALAEWVGVGANKVGALLGPLEQRGLVHSRRLPTGRMAWRLSREGVALLGVE